MDVKFICSVSFNNYHTLLTDFVNTEVLQTFARKLLTVKVLKLQGKKIRKELKTGQN
jgi:hypothetical protein